MVMLCEEDRLRPKRKNHSRTVRAENDVERIVGLDGRVDSGHAGQGKHIRAVTDRDTVVRFGLARRP